MQDRANELLKAGNREARRIPYERALKVPTTSQADFAANYTRNLGSVINMDAIAASGIRIGVDPLGGASIHYWEPIRERFGLNLSVVNPKVDPTFSFMTVDQDGKIRMDCSSKWAMQGLVKLQKSFDIAFATDPDADRHGIVTPSHGLMDPNHYLAAAIHFLHTRRPGWPLTAAVGKTVVSSAMIDRVVQSVGRRLAEVPVGFKWFVGGLHQGNYCFGGEESAGASFLRKDETVWTTDKDGLLLGLLAAEIRPARALTRSSIWRTWRPSWAAPTTAESMPRLRRSKSERSSGPPRTRWPRGNWPETRSWPGSTALRRTARPLAA